jgi:hypothetical protein
MQSLRHEEAYRADIGTALKFLVAIDKLNILNKFFLVNDPTFCLMYQLCGTVRDPSCICRWL